MHSLIRSSFLLGSVVLVALTLGAARTACAQELGEAGNLAFSAERLFGFYIGRETIDLGPTERKTDFTDLSLGWNEPPTPLTAPRLGVDYFIDENFTLGGSFSLYSLSMDPGAGDTTVTGILFAIRGGYALRLGHTVTFWPRAGFSYTTLSADGLAFDRHLLALNLEGVFALSPADGWAVLVGPSIDLGFTGEAANRDLTENSFGVMAGLLGYFGT